MTIVPRRARQIPEPSGIAIDSAAEDLKNFRSHTAWVLLGEPGAGKSQALETEAAETGGIYLRIADFIIDDPDADWHGKTLFLDGLDEIRASGNGDTTLQLLRRQLKRLGSPPFRLACRAADWYGSTDRADLKAVSPDGQIEVLLLEPLSRDDILKILRDNHGIEHPQAFVGQAEQRGVANLLDNPETLRLLAKAIQGNQWPRSRDETYQLACEKLAQEESKRKRDEKRAQQINLESVLDAAGQLSAILLLSDKIGLAQDPASANDHFPNRSDFAPPDAEAALQAIGSKLFRPEGEERFVHSHRSIAEYLAARWLAQKIDREALPLGRVLNLLLGRDGRTVAGLRGLYGWLALRCHAARQRLIDADPLTVVLYGDVKPMPVTNKRHILAALRQEAERFAGFRWDTRTTQPFGALVDAALHDDFLSILQSPDRDEASQSHADCVLEILLHGDAQPELAPTVLNIVRDDTRWSRIRKTALDTWLKLTTDMSAAIHLLDEITAGRITDQDDQLAGALLQRLYPKHLGPHVLLSHLHKPKAHLLGRYSWFWIHELPRCAPDEHLPALLDHLVDCKEIRALDPYERRINKMADELLARGIATYGEQITDERLFVWLGIGSDKYGNIKRGEQEQEIIAGWLSARPERYKAVFSLCFHNCRSHEKTAYCIYTQAHRLHNATTPDDLGLWHLEQATPGANEALAKIHLAQAANSLMYQRGTAGLSLDKLIAWGDAHPEQQHWLAPLLTWEIPEWRTEQNAYETTRQQKHAKSRRENTQEITPLLEAIRNGSAHPGVMNQLAGVWANHFVDVPGETPTERFNNYCENGDEVLDAAEAGFRVCPERTDLPTVDEIIDLNIKQREHFIRLPCLLGMDLRWQDGVTEIERLSDEVLRRMIAFRLTYSVDNAPPWFTHCVSQRAGLFAEVLIVYATAALNAGHDYIDSIHPLAHDPAYRTVATIAAPSLLETFPVRARSGQLNSLEYLLKAALRYTPTELQILVKKKTTTKRMDVGQKIYWHTAATLLDPKNYEPALWRYAGKSPLRTNHVSAFLGERRGEPDQNYDLSSHFIGKLIELLAPHAETEWPHGGGVRTITDAVRRGDQVRALIARLGAMATPDAEMELTRLLGLHTLNKLKRPLEDTRHQLKLRQRENEFRFLPVRNVAQILANKAPTSIADLAALALDHLDEIAKEICQDNDDGFRTFWNVENKKPISQREENLCRDVILTRLRARLTPFDIDSQPEGDYAKDKRADLRLSYKTEFELPIEIKRDSNKDLWTALHKQLIAQYAISPRADGYGIYLVLWFGGKNIPPAIDGEKKPRSATELRTRLEAQLDPIERQRIFVRVLDVSWPE